MTSPSISAATRRCRCEMCDPVNPAPTWTRKHMAWCLARELARWTRPDREAFLITRPKAQRDWLIKAVALIHQESKR